MVGCLAGGVLTLRDRQNPGAEGGANGRVIARQYLGGVFISGRSWELRGTPHRCVAGGLTLRVQPRVW